MSTELASRQQRLRSAILAAAEDVFLRDGYRGASMDEIAAIAHVSKQTVYKHFGSKERLFVELVSSMTDAAGDPVGHESAVPAADVEGTLVTLATAMLDAVLTPRILRLRRLVIGEADRFPDLGRALHAHGPARAIAGVQRRLEAWSADGVLPPVDGAAAQRFNWIVMGAPLNDAMLLGDDAILPPAARHAHATAAVRAFVRSLGADLDR